MSRALAFLMFASVSLFAFGPTAALAQSPSERECEAAGGTFTREQGEVQCVTEETVGNAPEHSNAQRTTTEETGQGNITPKEGELVCSGPPGQQDPACP
jgi:hypothetical protein